MSKNNTRKMNMVIYQAKSGAIELRGDLEHKTIWATQAQIAFAFDVDVRTVNEHILNIYTTKELPKKGTIRKFRIVQKEGSREVVRNIQHYNLDVLISVGYRVNSKKATAFRQWATKTLRHYIVDGYVINKKRITKNYSQFLEAIKQLKGLLPDGKSINNQNVVELISFFADTWLSLNAYDKGVLKTRGLTKKQVDLNSKKLVQALINLKKILLKKKEATELFGAERQSNSVAGIFGNIMQSFDSKDLYPSVEEKAVNLLYFFVKNHPFVDGNKRSGAYAFVWFLRQTGILDTTRITPPALTALTLLVAESNPKEKDKMIGLLLMLLR